MRTVTSRPPRARTWKSSFPVALGSTWGFSETSHCSVLKLVPLFCSQSLEPGPLQGPKPQSNSLFGMFRHAASSAASEDLRPRRLESQTTSQNHTLVERIPCFYCKTLCGHLCGRRSGAALCHSRLGGFKCSCARRGRRLQTERALLIIVVHWPAFALLTTLKYSASKKAFLDTLDLSPCGMFCDCHTNQANTAHELCQVVHGQLRPILGCSNSSLVAAGFVRTPMFLQLERLERAGKNTSASCWSLALTRGRPSANIIAWHTTSNQQANIISVCNSVNDGAGYLNQLRLQCS